MAGPDSAEVGTYRYLRLGIPLLVVLLGAALVHRIFLADEDCWLGSISAYYYTAVLVASVLVAVLIVLFNADPGLMRRYGHLVAAIGLFLAIGLVVAMNAFTLPQVNPEGVAPPLAFQNAYRLILAAMVVVLVVIGVPALMDKFEHAVFWLEAGEIALFAAFWLIQTLELPDVVRRGEDEE